MKGDKINMIKLSEINRIRNAAYYEVRKKTDVFTFKVIENGVEVIKRIL
jgi:hypothetical protein